MRRLFVLMFGIASIGICPPVFAASCASGGACALGDRGPGGGRIVYVSAAPQWWGQYVEARPYTATRGIRWSTRFNETIYSVAAGPLVRQRIDARGIGMGAVNTQLIVQQNGNGQYAARIADSAVMGGKSDWVLPSRDELDAMYHLVNAGYWRTIARTAYWSSTENSDGFAWYQMFQDGTQFTDENGVGKVDGVSIRSNKDRVRNARHAGSGFPSYLYRIAMVRYVGPTRGSRPSLSAPQLTGKTCSEGDTCAVGDIGPAGGVVFYDAGTTRSWGRYLEASPKVAETSGVPWKRLSANDRRAPLYVDTRRSSARLQRNAAKLIGQGDFNTRRIVKRYGVGNYAARYASQLVINGYDDWFLPSVDELNEMYKFMHANSEVIDDTRNTFYWSSSEYDLMNAWTINFKDGQQFDREKYLVPKPGVKALRIRAIRAFG